MLLWSVIALTWSNISTDNVTETGLVKSFCFIIKPSFPKLILIISYLYRLYGILSNNYKISFSLEIHHPYEFHNDIDFKKCIEVINIVKNNNIEKSGKRKIGESLRSRIVELSIIFEL